MRALWPQANAFPSLGLRLHSGPEEAQPPSPPPSFPSPTLRPPLGASSFPQVEDLPVAVPPPPSPAALVLFSL